MIYIKSVDVMEVVFLLLLKHRSDNFVFCAAKVMHARSGKTIEVMGLMQGKIDGDTMIIMDAFALPVDGKRRVLASGECNTLF